MMKRIGFTAATILIAGALLPTLALAQNYTFGPNVRLNDDPPGSEFHCTYSPGMHGIAARGDTVYVVWRDDRGAYSRIYLARSTDAGQTFSANVRVDNTPSGCAGIAPSMAVDDSGRIHVSWTNYNTVGLRFVYYAKSTDGGRGFLPPVRASDSIYGDQYGLSSIAVSRSGRRVYVVRDEHSWLPSNPFRILVSRSTDGGATFLTPDTRVTPDTGVMWPSVAVLLDTIVIVAWDKPDSDLTYFARSIDGGASFLPQKLVGLAGNSSMATDDSGRVFLALDGPRLLVSQDAGDSFGPEIRIPNEGHGGLRPSIWASRSGQLYVAYWFFWSDDDVRFAYSPNAGDTFFAPVNPSRAPYMARETWAVVTANDAGSAFVAWVDDRNHNPSLYYDVYCAAGTMTAIEEVKPKKVMRPDFVVTPRPSRGDVTISYALRAPGAVNIRVLDEAGRIVAALLERREGIGQQTLHWNGHDNQGRRLASGVYFVLLETPDGAQAGSWRS